ncbi:hypothetical protein TNIN_92971 [Trichonephila inaurata madagascariensis]|uniref:Uncharacterized protein n=1 Tax=Trichonephila inaurata madagascariensis TaxID=2747483 RepID=A0A8X6WR62_9ARAC|nr:hypothetical protein TNIN_92971 [Trichonephila inaurata madagascariensis]
MLTLFCAILLQDFGQAIMWCKESLLQENANLSEVFGYYENILVLKNCIGSTFGGVFFLLTLLGFLNAFGAITLNLGFETGEWARREYVYNAIIYAGINFSLLLYLIFCGADVNEKDKDFRNEVNTYDLKSRLRNLRNDPNGYISALGHESIAFSACGYFKFTKSSILTGIGVLLTYSLLINQFQN